MSKPNAAAMNWPMATHGPWASHRPPHSFRIGPWSDYAHAVRIPVGGPMRSLCTGLLQVRRRLEEFQE
eukprot:5650827-Pyramimonas_sp.AAC.1